MTLLTWLKLRVFGSELNYQNKINGVVTKINKLVHPGLQQEKDLAVKIGLAKTQLAESKREIKAVLFESFRGDLKSWTIQEIIGSETPVTSIYLVRGDVSLIVEVPSFLYKEFRTLSDTKIKTAISDSKITIYQENSVMAFDFEAEDGAEIAAKFFKHFYPQHLGEFELDTINAKTKSLRSVSGALAEAKPVLFNPNL